MPRFASSFISFLALNSFRSSVNSELPKDLGELCWVDVYLWMMTLSMAMSLFTTVAAEFCGQQYGETIARQIGMILNVSRGA